MNIWQGVAVEMKRMRVKLVMAGRIATQLRPLFLHAHAKVKQSV